jgi:hypothetical protein
MMKNINQPMATCHSMGACLRRPGCPCTGACEKALRLAPGVIEGPYLPAPSRGERSARALLALACVAAAVAALAELALVLGVI